MESLKRKRMSGANCRSLAKNKRKKILENSSDILNWTKTGQLKKHNLKAQLNNVSTTLEEKELLSVNSSDFQTNNDEDFEDEPMEGDFQETTVKLSLEQAHNEIIPLEQGSSETLQMLNTNIDYPTDFANFTDAVRDTQFIERILATGSCRPKLKFPKNKSGRSFSSIHYEDRSWICYSPKLDAAYCEPCWLFVDKNAPNIKLNWTEGINDWTHLSRKIKIHERSLGHIQAVMTRRIWNQNKTVDKNLAEQRDIEEKYWSKVLFRLVKIILAISAGNMSLRGHSSNIDDKSSGNFLRIVKLVSEFDPILNDLLNDKTKKIKYLSPTIQNELIHLLANSLQQQLIKEIKQALYFSVILDSTQDITKVEQMSIVFRNVVVDKNSNALVIKESFIGFFDLNDHSSMGYEEKLTNILKDYGIDFKKCRGQGYDGAAVMSGIHNGLQAKIKKQIKNAHFIHCAAHNINLIISDAAKSLGMADFFSTIQSVYNFFAQSSIRWAIISTSKLLDAEREKSLKKLCPTRWEARHDAVFSVYYNIKKILIVLTNIELTSKNRDEKFTAQNIKKRMENIEFIFLLILWEKILKIFRGISKTLQSDSANMSASVELLDACVTQMKELSTSFDTIFELAKILAKQLQVDATLKSKRKIFRKRHFDELIVDSRIDNTNSSFEKKYFDPLMKVLLDQINVRSQGMKKVADTFSFLDPKVLFEEKNELQIKKGAEKIIEMYKDDIEKDFIAQLNSLIIKFKGISKDICGVKGLAEKILDYDLSKSFPDVLNVCILFCTLPVTVATCERSFSKLKIIKNYLRNSMSQGRLSDLSILSIEREKADELDIEEIIKIFKITKVRKMKI